MDPLELKSDEQLFPLRVEGEDYIFIVEDGELLLHFDGAGAPADRLVRSGQSFCSDEAHLSTVRSIGATDLCSLKKSALEDWTVLTRTASLATSRRFSLDEQLDDPNISLEQLKVHRTIGTGTNGRVKLVEHMTTSECFALKCLNKQAIKRAGSEQNVKSEIETLRQMDSSFIVKLVKCMRDSAQIYLLMELVPGGELFKVLQKMGKRMQETVAQFYVGCVVLALQHMHSKGIVYRDLKPENVVLDSMGYAKVTDLGCAKQLQEGERTFTLCGTMDYLCPEIILMKGHGTEADLWQLGMFIYELIVGKPAFDGPGNASECAKRILEGKLRFPPTMTSQAKDLISKLLHPDPSRRLGAKQKDMREIKAHPWFAKLDWNRLAVRRLKAPYVPTIKSPTDGSNFFKYTEEPDPPSDPDSELVLEELF
jgi:protein kinase A